MVKMMNMVLGFFHSIEFNDKKVGLNNPTFFIEMKIYTLTLSIYFSIISKMIKNTYKMHIISLDTGDIIAGKKNSFIFKRGG